MVKRFFNILLDGNFIETMPGFRPKFQGHIRNKPEFASLQKIRKPTWQFLIHKVSKRGYACCAIPYFTKTCWHENI